MRPPPVIGISTYAAAADWGSWAADAVLTPTSYVKRVLQAGGVPVLLPATIGEAALLEHLLDRIDGLMLIGGEDVCGLRVDRTESSEEHATHSDERDAFELALAREAWARRLPILAICRGAQVLNVALGGSLIADLVEAGFSSEHRKVRGQFNDHEVSFEPGSILEEMYGHAANVPSHHHQAVDRLAQEFRVTARTSDGVIEGYEATGQQFALAVQWHPEEAGAEHLFEALIAARAH
ncbi:gamma-glutamyl-gamma-aminobutyrate hydrolase family protein [Nocardioides aurantiacus]|uniref:gamma-glutamyl-gamma-aminobutyrate hydrolase family protein n=1 Tax=Nocardioides aurantiacus TaxID=86796 RepID=UPI00403F7AA5